MNCNIKFPVDAKLEYLSSGAEHVSKANCEFDGNMLINDAPHGFPLSVIDGNMEAKMWCKFKVTFPNGNDCTCQVTTDHWYYITRDGCECMRITRCEGDECIGDGNTGRWPCDKHNCWNHNGCDDPPQVTLTVESS